MPQSPSEPQSILQSTKPAPSASLANTNTNTNTENPPLVRRAGIFDALRTIRPGDFTTFYQAPCARESLLTGIGAGFAIGGLRFVVLSRDSTPNENDARTRTETRAGGGGGGGGGRSGTMATGTSAEVRNKPGLAGSKLPSLQQLPTQSPTAGAGTKTMPTSTTLEPSPKPTPRITTTRTSIPTNSSVSARAWRSMTWAILSFTLFSAGAHIFCQRRRSMEQAAMARASEIVARKREEKRTELLRRRQEDRERRRVEHERQKGERSRWGRWFGHGSD